MWSELFKVQMLLLWKYSTPPVTYINMTSPPGNILTHLNSSTPSHENYLSQQEKVILTVILSFLVFLGFFGNGIGVYILTFRNNYIDVPANSFILSQSLADLATAASILAYIIHMHRWNWTVIYIMTSFTWVSSLGSLFLLTLNRLLSVIDSLKYPKRMTPHRAKILVVFIWMASLAISLLHMVGYLIYSDTNVFNYGRYYIVALITAVIASNIYMFCVSRKQAQKIKRQNRFMTGLQKNLLEDLKSVKTLTLIGGTFLLSCLPFTLLVFLYGSQKESTPFQRRTAFLAPLIALNPVLDPIIYYLRSAEFRLFFQRFNRLYLKREPNVFSSPFILSSRVQNNAISIKHAASQTNYSHTCM